MSRTTNTVTDSSARCRPLVLHPLQVNLACVLSETAKERCTCVDLLDILEGHGKDEKYVARLIVGIYVHHHPVSESFC